jgi:hypothetical protein
MSHVRPSRNARPLSLHIAPKNRHSLPWFPPGLCPTHPNHFLKHPPLPDTLRDPRASLDDFTDFTGNIVWHTAWCTNGKLGINRFEKAQADVRQAQIARDMWAQYQGDEGICCFFFYILKSSSQ